MVECLLFSAVVAFVGSLCSQRRQCDRTQFAVDIFYCRYVFNLILLCAALYFTSNRQYDVNIGI